MAGSLFTITNAVFVNGVLVSASWSPYEPELITVSRESSKTRYTVYPTIKDDIDGTGVFVEVARSVTFARVALALSAAITLQDGIEGVAFAEADNKSTSGRYYESNRIIKAYTHEVTVETRETRMVSWTEGPPEVEE
jgi:hypothetical protein